MDNERIIDAQFPVQGIDKTSSEYDARQTGTSADALNVRALDSLERRFRGGSRSGSFRFVDQQVDGAHEIQLLQVVAYIAPETQKTSYFDPPRELFDSNDPSSPSPDGWSYDGDPDAPIDDDTNPYIGDPSVFTDTGEPPGPGQYFDPPGRNLDDKIPLGGDGWGLNQKPKIRPKILWRRLPAITFPMPLSSKQLSAQAYHPTTGAKIRGSYAYTPPAATLLQPTTTPFSTVLGNLPEALRIRFSWGDYTWTTDTSPGAFAAGQTIRYNIIPANLPHTLVDLNFGAANGKIIITNPTANSDVELYYGILTGNIQAHFDATIAGVPVNILYGADYLSLDPFEGPDKSFGDITLTGPRGNVTKPLRARIIAKPTAKPLRVIFTPADLETYLPATATNSIDVYPYPGGVSPAPGYPEKVTIYYEWGSYSVAFLSSAGTIAAGVLTYLIPQLPYTLVTIADGDPKGKLVVATDPTPGKVTFVLATGVCTVHGSTVHGAANTSRTFSNDPVVAVGNPLLSNFKDFYATAIALRESGQPADESHQTRYKIFGPLVT